MTSDSDKIGNDLAKYGRNYLSLTVQPAEAGLSDSQLGSAIPFLADRIAATQSGAIIDIGCGNGAFLTRLLEVPSFRENTGWIYVGVDEDEALNGIAQKARQAKVNRRTELFSLEDFYSQWPDIGGPQVVFCRNVMHELSLRDTASLISHIRSNIAESDTLFIQDLQKFPEAERHNACWILQHLEEVIRKCKFSRIVVNSQATASGNSYFNVTASVTGSSILSFEEAFEIVKEQRLQQWGAWLSLKSGLASVVGPQRTDVLEAIDLDLQIAALTRQLADAGLIVNLPSAVSKRVRANQFSSLLKSAAVEPIQVQSIQQEVDGFHFRERGPQLTIMESFLRSEETFAQVYGGSGYGKTTLVNRLLATRAYNKAVVKIDGKVAKSFWPFVEALLSQVGVRLAPEQLSVLDNLNVHNALPEIAGFINRHIDNIIIVFDNFDDALDSRHRIVDGDLADLITLVVKKRGAKFIGIRRSEFIPAQILSACSKLPVVVQVGRYASDDTVKNVLDDHFDRTAARISEYPDALIQAIDRHPLIASLVAKLLKQQGEDLLYSSQFLVQVKQRLRDELWSRMVGEQARDAVVAAAQLRVAVPRTLLERLASSESIRAAQEAEVIWSKKDDRWQSILSVLGLFRLRAITADDEEDAGVSYEALQISKNEEDVALHNKIAALYRGVYRLDDDPKWIRESFFHQLLANAGSSKDLPSRIGAYYGSELVSSADYYFSKAKDYVGALALYKLAASIVSLNDNAEMRYASCLIRTGDMAEGDKIYSKLISEFDGNIGFKTSYVDALLYRGDFERAKAKLEAFNLRDEKDWVRWQWGRVYGGLDQYDKAIEALKPLIGRPDGDPHFHVHYARALRAFGASDRALEVLKAAALQFPKETAIITAYAVERAEHGEVDAIGTLRELFTANASNTRAALVIIRSYLQDGDIGSAQRVLAEARKSAPASTRSIVEVADAEVIAARGQVDLAIAKLKTGTQDAGTIVSLIELMAVREGLSRSRNSDVISELSKIGILQRLRINAPVQKSILNLADTIGDASLRSEALARLQNTAVTPEELAAL